jgi:hypothetical protein
MELLESGFVRPRQALADCKVARGEALEDCEPVFSNNDAITIQGQLAIRVAIFEPEADAPLQSWLGMIPQGIVEKKIREQLGNN